MTQLEKGDMSWRSGPDKTSNSLLANVLDMDDDFLLAGGLRDLGGAGLGGQIPNTEI
jgi:hypothetical protein